MNEQVSRTKWPFNSKDILLVTNSNSQGTLMVANHDGLNDFGKSRVCRVTRSRGKVGMPLRLLDIRGAP